MMGADSFGIIYPMLTMRFCIFKILVNDTAENILA